jgi:hypothetical protein
MTHDPNSLADLLNRARLALADAEGVLPPASPATAEAGCVVFFAMGEGESRARVVAGRGPDIEAAWHAGRRCGGRPGQARRPAFPSACARKSSTRSRP